MTMFVLGIDCAAQPENTGLALAEVGESLRVHRVHPGRRGEDIAGTAARIIEGRAPLLVAIDAPLGWPAAMGPALVAHRAGEVLAPEPNALFRRATDDVVAAKIGKRPLDVGGDRIARAAHAALRLLDGLRERSGLELRVATRRGEGQVLEVYPAATLHVRGMRSSGYKGAGARAERREILAGLEPDLPAAVHEAALASDHLLDAILCCIAGRDYLEGPVLEPEDVSKADAEGWIWVRDPGAGP
jgi:hypothetical protein